jgi:hypothetical protein
MCEEAEALVEYYLQEISESLASLHLTRQQIDNTERYARGQIRRARPEEQSCRFSNLLKCLLLLDSLLMLRLDMARNSLLTITTIIGLISMCLALGSCVAGIFGAEMDTV